MTTEQRIAIATDYSAEKVKTINELVEDESIDFAEWCSITQWHLNKTVMEWQHQRSFQICTTKQLYSIYKDKSLPFHELYQQSKQTVNNNL